MSSNISYITPGPLKRITSPSSPNFCQLFYAPVENITVSEIVARQSDSSPDIVGTVYSLITCKGWYNTPLPDFKKSYTEEQKDGDGGQSIDVTIEAFIPFDSIKNHMTLDRLKYHRFILLVVTPQKMIKIIGSIDNPAFFSHTFKSNGASGSTGTSILFKWSTEDKPLIYSRLVNEITPVIK